MSTSELRASLVFCRLPELRLEVVAARGVVFVSDCYNASPRSMEAAIEEWRGLSSGSPPRHAARGYSDTQPGPSPSSWSGDSAGGRVAVLGDMLELGEKSRELHEEVGATLAGGGLRLLVTVGRDSRWIQEAYRSRGGEAEVCHYASAEESIPFLRAALRGGDHVLIKGSRRIGLERVSRDLLRWVRLFGGSTANGAQRRGAFRRLPAGVGACFQES
jgi:UDP-N-acetylmuramoyl-tripeptide--D-alanyl-D-alanine ligase